MVVYVKVPGDQAGEVNITEGIGRANRFGRPGEGAGVDICQSEFGGAGAEAAVGGVNIEVNSLC